MLKILFYYGRGQCHSCRALKGTCDHPLPEETEGEFHYRKQWEARIEKEYMNLPCIIKYLDSANRAHAKRMQNSLTVAAKENPELFLEDVEPLAKDLPYEDS